MRFRAAPARRAEPRAGPGSWASASPRARRRTPSPFPTRTWGLRGARGARRAGRAEGLRGWASGTQSARLGSAGPAPLPRRPPEPCAHPRPPSARRASRGARVEGHSARTMELSESVQKGFQLLADPGAFGPGAFALVLRAAFQSLLGAQADGAVLDHPDLKHIDPVILKHCHAAAATCILEAGKQRADKSTLSSYLEDCKFDRERIELFCTEYQVT
ncbi:COMM domain-containing protein 3 isoform X5 [Choloepus didactylus]|uniref:COMM domain-containing protein 3 isoform X5 n=1 Tax=Choloepus didactylus TaxID=27675 RepID=UPI00189DD2E4|nr:COMM domain-containing protein 3 isoform X5 [Choloepus didactylus]